MMSEKEKELAAKERELISRIQKRVEEEKWGVYWQDWSRDARKAGLSLKEAHKLYDRYYGIDNLPVPISSFNTASRKMEYSWELSGVGIDEYTVEGSLSLEDVKMLVTATDKEFEEICDRAFKRLDARHEKAERDLEKEKEEHPERFCDSCGHKLSKDKCCWVCGHLVLGIPFDDML